jgi:zinc transport system permease protein
MLQYSFMRNAFMAAIIISILYPTIGMFLVLKRHSMMGDTLSHASFAGVAIGLLIGINPIISALIFTSIAAIFVESLKSYYKKYAELILAITLTFSVGVAITIISMGKASANVNSYLFGSILTVTKQDLMVILIIGIIVLAVLAIFHNQFIYTTFDEEGASIAGIKVKILNYVFALLVGATIALSIRIMGILVLSSMMVIPVATSLQLGRGFKQTLIFAVIIGFIDILGGLVLSYYINSAPGGTIALASVFMLFTVLILKKSLGK